MLFSFRCFALFEKQNVLSRRELESRYEVYHETYNSIIDIEAKCAVTMAMTMIVPAAVAYQAELAETVQRVESAGVGDAVVAKGILAAVSEEVRKLYDSVSRLKDAIGSGPAPVIDLMAEVRAAADELEGLLPDELWPLPSYADMMFIS